MLVTSYIVAVLFLAAAYGVGPLIFRQTSTPPASKATPTPKGKREPFVVSTADIVGIQVSPPEAEEQTITASFKAWDSYEAGLAHAISLARAKQLGPAIKVLQLLEETSGSRLQAPGEKTDSPTA